MPAQLLNGKQLAEKILLQVKTKTASMDNNPGLAAILVGDNEASKLYLRLKEKACLQAGINFHSYLLSEACDENKILEVINFLNNDSETNGIIVQLPLPEKFNTDLVMPGRHVLTPEVFYYLKKTKAGEKGELILAEVLQKMLMEGKLMFGYEIEGRWLECGNKADWLKTNIYLSLKDLKYGPEIKRFLKENKVI
ncbi:MAG: hypothetical protein NT116_03915 [Candidatus Parcubacteria bacterium]|nr:hypothetical protein [Candidatus Parcubacteria bacterium]